MSVLCCRPTYLGREGAVHGQRVFPQVRVAVIQLFPPGVRLVGDHGGWTVVSGPSSRCGQWPSPVCGHCAEPEITRDMSRCQPPQLGKIPTPGGVGWGGWGGNYV